MPHRIFWTLAALPVIGGAALFAAGGGQPQAPRPEMIDTAALQKSFDDDFTGDRLDPRKWSSGNGAGAVTDRTLGNNAERQVYFDPKYLSLGIQPISVRGGVATITARPLTPVERTMVAAAVDTLPPAQRSPVFDALAYSSGRFTTQGRFSQKYGYFEARIRFDPGRGLWPALWLLPASGGWPPEIDIMEALGHDPGTVYMTAHSATLPRQTVTSKLAPSDGNYHRYGVMWGPETIDVYVDGAKTGSVKTPPDAHQPMYLIVNLAVGGHWPGYPDASTRFPATMDIDYVRAWKFPDLKTRR